MGPLNDVYNWGSVKALYATVSSMNLAGLIAVVLAIVWAVRFQKGFGDYLNLVAPGDGYAWTTVIIFAAVLCTPAYILGLRSCFHLRTEFSKADFPEEEQPVDELQRVANRLLFFHVIACLLSGFLVAVLNATYLALLSGFQQKSRDGLMQAIQRYGSDATAKERVDAVQTEFECCGDNGYEDWFRVPWLELAIGGPDHPESGPQLEEQSVPDDREEAESTRTADVPFSCCSNDIPKPCVHHDILNPSVAYDYNPKHPTIATLGCRTKIMDRAVTVRIFLSGYLAVVTVYQVTLSFLSRLLQTAHSNDLYIGFRKPRYRAWILFGPKETSSEAALLERNSRNLQLKKRSGRKPPPSPATSFSSSSSSSSSSSHSTLSSLEEEKMAASRVARKAKSSDAKMLDEIRSRISSVKSKSLPLLVESNTSIANELRVSKRDVRLSKNAVLEVIDEGVGRSRDEKERRGDGGSKLLSEHATWTEMVLRPHYDSLEVSPGGRSINEYLPPLPPPPPFVPRFEAEQEQEQAVVGTLREQRSFGKNSGRRAKVLERFGKIEGRNDRVARHRESGGADFVESDSTVGSDRSKRTKPSPGDVYDRFRGSLQHTLARREAARSKRSSRGRARTTEAAASLEARRSSLLARLGCRNVPPSYRLLANLEDKKRPATITYPAPTSITAPPFPQNPWSANRGGTEQRRCSVCHRSVRQSPTSSRGSFAERDDVAAAPVNDLLENGPRSREAPVSWNRASSASKPVLRR